MIVYRISKEKYARKLDGKGASSSAINRWNSRGTEIIYTSSSIALARAELGGHINLALVPSLVVSRIEISDDQITVPDSLPDKWDKVPPGDVCKLIGDQFIEEDKHLVLRVPSRYDPDQYNYPINPNHKDFKKTVKILEVKSIIG